MKDGGKTKEQLINELAELRQRIAELEASEAERKQAEEEVAGLAKFPGENPNPVLRVAEDGTILYANRGSTPLLNVWGCQVNQPLPDDWRKFTADVLSSGASKDAEVEVEDRILSLTFAPVVDAGYVNVYGLDITERKRAEEQIKAALAEKEVLLKEIHHRVKNNLQALIYLMDMQAETVEDPEALRTLAALQGRTRAMALVHEKLYQAQDLARIDFGDYLEDLTANLLYALGGGRDIALRVDAADLFINVNSAIPCGLIVNELVTNALKHAFPPSLHPASGGDGGGECEIRVVFESRDGEYVLTVSDNGVGLPPALDWRTAEALGLKLVDIWATYQLGGSIELDSREGTAFTVRFSEW